MGIKNIKTITPGVVGVDPSFIFIDTDDTAATVLTSTYLNSAKKLGYSFDKKQMALVYTTDGGPALFEVAIDGDDVGLKASFNPGNVTLPVTNNFMAVFDGTTGKIKQNSGATSNQGSIFAGSNGTAGAFRSYPSTAGKGFLALTANNNAGNFAINIANASHGQASTYFIPDVGEALGSFLVNPLDMADINANIVTFDVSVGQAALASGGSVTLQASSGTKQYKIRQLYLNSGGTDFSGGGGDRLATISDGTTDFSVIPAGTLQSLANTRWGETGLPFPAAASINTSTAAGDAITIAYSGGTSDYAAGSMVISGVLERVA